MFRLYCGLVKNDKWYNMAELDEVKGGSLAILDNPDKSPSKLMLKMVKLSVKTLFTQAGDKLELQDDDYLKLRFIDGWKVALELMRQFTGQDAPVFPEYFLCPVCSKGEERYTRVEESWFDLIGQGIIQEHYLESPEDMRFVTHLKDGFVVPDSGSFKGGTYKEITREFMTFEDMRRLSSAPILTENEIRTLYTVWDLEIKEIKGMDPKDFQRLVKNNLMDSFTKKYLNTNADIELLKDKPKIGIDASNREIYCCKCDAQIGGYLDFTNFFDFLFRRKSLPSSMTMGV